MAANSALVELVDVSGNHIQLASDAKSLSLYWQRENLVDGVLQLRLVDGVRQLIKLMVQQVQ